MNRRLLPWLTVLALAASAACSNDKPAAPAAPAPAMRPAPVGGVGGSLDFAEKGADLVFSRVFKDSPAAKAGVKPGDRVLRINDRPTASMTMDAAMSLFKGPAGTTMTLQVATGNDPPRDVTVTREIITSREPLPGPAKPAPAGAPAAATAPAPGTAAPAPAVAPGSVAPPSPAVAPPPAPAPKPM
jgi:membrane-associated protease RseP (regulator of RpoE activity)